MRKIIGEAALAIFLFMIFSAAMAKWSTFGQEKAENTDRPAGFSECDNPHYDVDELKTYFPNLKGIQGCIWEVERIADKNKRTPGPTDLHIRGQISISEEQSQEYLQEYQWTPDDPEISASTFYAEGFRSAKWMSSNTFEEDVMAEEVWGNMWFDGKSIWFDILY